MTMAIQMIATGGVLALSTMAPTVAAALGVNPELIGYQVSLIYLTAAISSVTAGGMVRKFGAARMSQASMASFVVALLCFGSGLLPLMAAGAALCGLGYGLNNPAASHILIRVTPPARRNTVFSIKQAGVPLGGVAAGLCFPALAALISWQAGLWLAALAPLLLIVLLARLRPCWDADRMPEARIGQDWTLGARLAMKLPPLRTLSLLGLLYSMLQLSLSTFTVAMLVTEQGWTPIAAGSALALVQASGAVGRVLWGFVADRLRAGFLVLAMVGAISGAGALLIGAAGDIGPVTQIALLCVIGNATNGWNGIMLAESARRAPEGLVGTITGGVLIFTFAGVVIGPASFAALHGLVGSYANSFLCFGLVSLAGAAMAAHRHRVERR
jgi:MFS family permease